MKRLILTAICLWLIAIGNIPFFNFYIFTFSNANAAPALRSTMTVTQPDGTLLTIEQHGDEWHHWTTVGDGVMVVNTGEGYYVAAINGQGELVTTGVLAHEPALRSSRERDVAQRQAGRQALFHQRGEQQAATARRAMVIGNGGYLPHTDTVRVLTVLAAFNDLDFSVNEPTAAFDQILNGNEQTDFGNHNELNIGSVRKYFETCSDGLFSPQFDVVGPVTVPQNMAYYGGTDGVGGDDKFGTFCKDVLEKAKPLVDDWSIYDNDGDGTVELVCVIFAGYGQNQGGANNTLWAKASGQNLKVEGSTYVKFFNCSSELFHPQREGYINGTGVFIHEMSHCMGLPDLYATAASGYVDNQGMETWDVMDYGLYNRNGFAPAPYTAWEQETMGWTEIEALPPMDNGQLTIDNMLPLIEGGTAYKIPSSDNDRDFIVLENMQQRGINSYAYGHGLLVYHVAYPYNTVSMTDHPNNNPDYPAIAVVPAGGLLISSYLRGKEGSGKPHTNDEWKETLASCVFPGTKGITELTDNMQLPNYRFYGNGYLPVGHALLDITEDDDTGTMSLTVSDNPTGIQTLNSERGTWNGEMYNIAGQRVQRSTLFDQGQSDFVGYNVQRLPVICNGKKVMMK